MHSLVGGQLGKALGSMDVVSVASPSFGWLGARSEHSKCFLHLFFEVATLLQAG